MGVPLSHPFQIGISINHLFWDTVMTMETRISDISEGFQAPELSAEARSARLEDHFSLTAQRSAAHRLPPVLVGQGGLFLGVPRHVVLGAAARPSATELGEIWGLDFFFWGGAGYAGH